MARYYTSIIVGCIMSVAVVVAVGCSPAPETITHGPPDEADLVSGSPAALGPTSWTITSQDTPAVALAKIAAVGDHFGWLEFWAEARSLTLTDLWQVTPTTTEQGEWRSISYPIGEQWVRRDTTRTYRRFGTLGEVDSTVYGTAYDDAPFPITDEFVKQQVAVSLYYSLHGDQLLYEWDLPHYFEAGPSPQVLAEAHGVWWPDSVECAVDYADATEEQRRKIVEGFLRGLPADPDSGGAP
jgi:hypothetical protein